MEKAVHIKPTKTQSGGFLGTLLASIGIPLAVEAIKKLTGGNAPRIGAKTYKNRGGSAPQIGLPKWPPPLYSYPNKRGRGKKKVQKGKGLFLGPNSPFQNIPILGAIL